MNNKDTQLLEEAYKSINKKVIESSPKSQNKHILELIEWLRIRLEKGLPIDNWSRRSLITKYNITKKLSNLLQNHKINIYWS
jgi:hypothetical protein